MPPNVVTAMKRKLADFIEDEDNYGFQRQSILNISMCKLRMVPRRRVEPCLRRNVLILNTLKHIETELEMEGVCIQAPSDTTFNLTDPGLSKMDLDPLPECSPNSPLIPPTNTNFLPPVVSEGPLSPMPKPVQEVENMDTSAKDVPGKTVLDLVPCKLALTDMSSTCASISKLSSQTHVEDANNNVVPSFASFTSHSSASWNEDCFSDISSVCDADIYSISSEVLHSFPNTSGHASDAYASIISSQCGTSFRNEYMMDELDNIMQILVGM